MLMLMLHLKSLASLTWAAEDAAGRWPKEFIAGTLLHSSAAADPLRALPAELETADLPGLSAGR